MKFEEYQEWVKMFYKKEGGIITAPLYVAIFSQKRLVS